ncbi:fumarylacetoacetase [Paraburkholderia sacchari]|uniref:fumarylacetoacetase n=1 Tax=Paraburkholderia sacchari TaxID=159450 RepID=UPI001BCFF74F|nr:fumarylacetoacetase [Paraburkholderia sacchari]
MTLDETHDPARRSWVDSANNRATDFPIQNLPLGMFTPGSGGEPRPGIAIGDNILDLVAAHQLKLLPESIREEAVFQSTLNALFASGPRPLQELRRRVGELLDAGPTGMIARDCASKLLHNMGSSTLHRPTAIANYTDFYAGIHHAIAAGVQLTPDDPLPTNYKWVPIAYHGRASSVRASGASVRRPWGQRPPAAGESAPAFGPCERLDFELEMGFYIGAGNQQGESIPLELAGDQIVGYSLLNDWSARDVQRWEMFPLGPFLSKSFATSISPWVVTADALLPFRAPAFARPVDDPQPLPYLLDEKDRAEGNLDVILSVFLSTERMRANGEKPVEIMASNARHVYWTPAQMVTHHTVNGCNLMPGDLIGTGTISGPSDAELGSMLELTVGGHRPISLPNGERRTFLADGDEITIRGRCERAGFAAIGFGSCIGTIVAAR